MQSAAQSAGFGMIRLAAGAVAARAGASVPQIAHPARHGVGSDCWSC